MPGSLLSRDVLATLPQNDLADVLAGMKTDDEILRLVDSCRYNHNIYNVMIHDVLPHVVDKLALEVAMELVVGLWNVSDTHGVFAHLVDATHKLLDTLTYPVLVEMLLRLMRATNGAEVVFDMKTRVLDLLKTTVFFCNLYHRSLLCQLLYDLRACRDPDYLVCDVASNVLEMMSDGVHVDTARTTDAFLGDVARSGYHGLLTNSPLFVHCLSVVSGEYEAEHLQFVLPIVEAAGTSFLVVLARHPKQAEVTAAVRRLARKVDGFEERVTPLWPRWVANVLEKEVAPDCVRDRDRVRDRECPITLETCEDPVLASDGVVYERDAILHYLVLNSPMRSPMTRQPLSSKVVAAL